MKACLISLFGSAPTLAAWTVTVVDNASRDGVVEAVRARFPTVTVIELESNRGFAAGVNRGIQLTAGDFVLVLNPDTELDASAVDRMLSALYEDEGAAVVGPRLIDRAGRPDHNAKRDFPTPASALRHFAGRRPRSSAAGAYARTDVGEFERAPVGAVSGSCMLVRRAAIAQVGLLDERYWMYGEDLDWCRRFGARGWRVIYAGDATVIHVKHGLTGRRRPLRLNWAFHRAMGRFYRRFDAGARPGVDAAVYTAIVVKFALSASSGLIRTLAERLASAVGRLR